MASSSSSSSEISQEEFFAFHNLDRQLFSRLVFNLRREPSEAMQAAALWLWLERLNMAQYVTTLLTFPDTVFEGVFEETLLCLRAAESDEWFYPSDIPMVQSIVGKHRDGVNLKFFHENRINVLLGVGNIIQQICIRAFQDLLQVLLTYNFDPTNNYHEYPPLSDPYVLGGIRDGPNFGVIGDRVDYHGSLNVGVIGGDRVDYHGSLNVGVIGDGGSHGRGGFTGLRPVSQPPLSPIYEQEEYPNLIRVGDFSVPLKGHLNVSKHSPTNMGPMSSGNSNYALETQTQAIQGDLVDQFIAQLRVSENSRLPMIEDPMQSIPSSERTIFLTFSKGYPISEPELREFFSRSFGDIIDTLHMQDVGDKEQPLYARLVVKDPSAMEVILSRQGRSKFSINGKHVWARKYVRKNTNSPPNSPTFTKAK